MEVARARGALTLAVTNNASSPLAQSADVHLDVLAGPELAVAATKSYTAQLLALSLLLERYLSAQAFSGCRPAARTAGHDRPAGAGAGRHGGRCRR